MLLIDEVDVFFKNDFYGNTYVPSASIKDPAISALIDYIWKERASKPKLKTIQESKEYQKCVQTFVGWNFLIDEAIKDMLVDVCEFSGHGYEVQSDKICYRDQDGFSSDIIYGYKTLFAYYQEKENGTISAASLEENKAIEIHCGKFSYAKIIHQFNCIMGVTGTLKFLNAAEKNVIENEYNLKKYTYLPSIYGNKNINKLPHVDIYSQEEYFAKLYQEIMNCIQGKQKGAFRAVMVFFETEKALLAFCKSPQMEGKSVNILTEHQTGAEKIANIRRATVVGQISLLTRSYGRGTDFICRDDEVNANWGIHVIQTFLSEELSEEIQIKGRTARQGEDGSYSLCLKLEDLEKFKISEEDVKKTSGNDPNSINNRYNLIDQKRNAFFLQQYEQNNEYLAKVKKEHDDSMGFLNALTPVEEKDSEMPPSSIMKAANTRGDGDCPFHSILGVWDKDEKCYIDNDIKENRGKVGDAIRELAEGKDIKGYESIRKLCVAGIKALIMVNHTIGKETQQLLKAYLEFSSEKEHSLWKASWITFERELHQNDNKEILKFIEKHGAGAGDSLKERFYKALNIKSGELYARIMSLPALQQSFDDYNEFNNYKFNHCRSG